MNWRWADPGSQGDELALELARDVFVVGPGRRGDELLGMWQIVALGRPGREARR